MKIKNFFNSPPVVEKKPKETPQPPPVIERKIAEASQRLSMYLIDMDALEKELNPLLEKRKDLQQKIDSMKTRLSMLEKKR